MGSDIDDAQIELLGRYQQWLIDEAIPAGALGPGEQDRIPDRHIGDSILFLTAVEDPSVAEVWDFGSGVGLPGMVMAIVRPGVGFKLLERSATRCRLSRRVTRILDLENVEVIEGDLSSLPTDLDCIVSRATLSPALARDRLRPHLRPGGWLVLGGSWARPPREPGWEVREVPRMILDHDVWLLMMRQT